MYKIDKTYDSGPQISKHGRRKETVYKLYFSNVFLEILFLTVSKEQLNIAERSRNNWVKGIQGIIKQFRQIMEKFNIKK